MLGLQQKLSKSMAFAALQSTVDCNVGQLVSAASRAVLCRFHLNGKPGRHSRETARNWPERSQPVTSVLTTFATLPASTLKGTK